MNRNKIILTSCLISLVGCSVLWPAYGMDIEEEKIPPNNHQIYSQNSQETEEQVFLSEHSETSQQQQTELEKFWSTVFIVSPDKIEIEDNVQQQPEDKTFISGLKGAVQGLPQNQNVENAFILTHLPENVFNKLSEEEKAYCLAYAARFGDARAFQQLSSVLISYVDPNDEDYAEKNNYLTDDMFLKLREEISKSLTNHQTEEVYGYINLVKEPRPNLNSEQNTPQFRKTIINIIKKGNNNE